MGFAVSLAGQLKDFNGIPSGRQGCIENRGSCRDRILVDEFWLLSGI